LPKNALEIAPAGTPYAANERYGAVAVETFEAVGTWSSDMEANCARVTLSSRAVDKHKIFDIGGLLTVGTVAANVNVVLVVAFFEF
jgi:hypothetical protein